MLGPNLYPALFVDKDLILLHATGVDMLVILLRHSSVSWATGNEKL